MSKPKSNTPRRGAVAFAAIDPYLEQYVVLPTEKELPGQDRVQWGTGNRYPDYINELYETVPTLQTIINGSVDFVAGDEVTLTVGDHMEPSPISRTDCEGWERVKAAVGDTWPGCIVSPYLMVQCSDSRHYRDLSRHVYRFSAMDLTGEERKSIHGNNERIRLDCLHRAVEYYIRLMKKC